MDWWSQITLMITTFWTYKASVFVVFCFPFLFSLERQNTSLKTSEKRYHYAPCNILCVSPRGLHPNVTFPYESQNWDFYCPKILDNISLSNQVFLKVQEQYLISLENIFPMVYNTLQLDLIWPLLSKDLCSRVKFPIWLPPFLLIITHAN